MFCNFFNQEFYTYFDDNLANDNTFVAQLSTPLSINFIDNILIA
jgi:hypothetical protein